MPARVALVAAFLCVSGLCALIFQTAWLRDFRLIFGSSTPAAAAVLAVFMGGLGLGNAFFGRRVDASPAPLRFYAALELGISIAAGLSPFLVQTVRGMYIALGGQQALGIAGATVVRLLLTALVIGVPTFLMGGTLPAAARAATATEDAGRRSIGWLYGLNTLGAVLGALLATFVLLELFGTRETLWIAVALNLVNAALAWRTAQRWAATPDGTPRPDRGSRRKSEKTKEPPTLQTGGDAAAADLQDASPVLIYAAAGIVGFAFFLMELVWYRMLGPILGGTTFTFGLILAVALAGIGVGGAVYPLLFRSRVPTLRDLALSCAWEALAIAVPFALGDRVAIFALVLQGLRYFGFAGQTLGWTLVALVVIFPAAVVSGIQFPLLIALLGRGSREVGRQVGPAFAWNTAGAIAGSLAGGFGLVPVLTAPGAWKFVFGLLSLLAILLALAVFRRQRRAGQLLHPLAVTAAATACLFALGPTSVWRHSGIGAGRAWLPPASNATRNDLIAWKRDRQRNIVWQADGREVSVAVSTASGVAFLVGGKSDGNAATDAGTQIMFSVLAAMLHPQPQEGLVIGLGTGESAGWLATLPTMQRVDVVELEPAIAAVAAASTALNHDVLHHPKVQIEFNDAREALQTTRRKYDVIASEPSNPYRAGVASLYTLDFYRAVRERLKPGGLFAQWVQGYEIDVLTMRIVLATLRTAFPYVEVWQAKPGDLVMICSAEPLAYELARLQERVAQPAYAEALRVGWRTQTVEGVLAHYLANERFVTAVAAQEPRMLNTDNQNYLEYSFARTVGVGAGFSAFTLREEARARNQHRPSAIASGVNWEAVEDALIDFSALIGDVPLTPQAFTGPRSERAQAMADVAYYNGTRLMQHFVQLQRGPRDWTELYALAFAHAQHGSEQARPLLVRLAEHSPLEAKLLEALLLHQSNKTQEAAPVLAKGLIALRSDARVLPSLGEPIMKLAVQIVEKDPQQAAVLFDALSKPFALHLFNDRRMRARILVGQRVGAEALAAAVAEMEPYYPWEPTLLEVRLRAYEAVKSPRALVARQELLKFRRGVPQTQLLNPPAQP